MACVEADRATVDDQGSVQAEVPVNDPPAVDSRKKSKLSALFKVPSTPAESRNGPTTISNSATQTPTRLPIQNTSSLPVSNTKPSKAKTPDRPSSSSAATTKPASDKSSVRHFTRSVTEDQIWKTQQEIKEIENFLTQNQVNHIILFKMPDEQISNYILIA